MEPLKPSDYADLIRTALAEDTPGGDVTTQHLFDADAQGTATLIAKAPGVIAGLPVFASVFATLDPDFRVETQASDGDRVTPGQIIARLTGRIRTLLTGERVALNILQRCSGIASAAALYVDAVRGLPVTILDTRKTAPGLRAFDKYAVRTGGARNHRMTLSDLAMVKDNHLRLAGGITTAVQRLRSRCPGLRIEVETETLAEVREALDAGADIIMLDNMPLDRMREAVALIAGRCPVEASGNVTLDTVRAIAETGVTFISVGALTHSVKALDISLKVDRPG
jgi:nicotinate-nucleotide pyrophosphorylase (carboxylating)